MSWNVHVRVRSWDKNKNVVIHDDETYCDDISVLISRVGLSSNLLHIDFSL